MMILSEIMTLHPLTLGPTNSVKQAMDLMQQEHIRHIPIVDEYQHLLGLVTLTDILATRESKLLLINPEREAEFTDSVPLDAIMTRRVASAAPDAGIKQAARYLQQHKYGCLPVLQGSKLIGIVTESDFIAVAINLLELIAKQEPLTDF